MECYDTAWTGVLADIGKYPGRGDCIIVVPGKDVPHYNIPRITKHPAILHGAHPSVRGAEELAGLEYFLSLLRIGNVLPVKRLEAAKMIIGMVPYPMAAFPDLGQKMRIADSVFAYHEKGGFYTEFIQNIKYERCSLWNRTIVKGEIY